MCEAGKRFYEKVGFLPEVNDFNSENSEVTENREDVLKFIDEI